MSHRRPANRKRCCDHFPALALEFVDESIHLDASLSLLADLCLSAVDLEALGRDTLSELGAALRKYLERRLVTEHYFFGRSLSPLDSDDSIVAGELMRLSRRDPIR